MGEKNNKIILTSLIGILIVIVVVFVIMIAKKGDPSQPQSTTPSMEVSQSGMPEESTPSAETEMEPANEGMVAGRIISFGTESMVILTAEELELIFNIPQEGASFVSQVEQEDGSFSTEEIDQTEVSVNKEVEVQYDLATNNVMRVIVK